MIFKEKMPVDGIKTQSKTFNEQFSELINKFSIFDEQGNLLREGSNIVLNVGRTITSNRLLGRPIEIEAGISTDGLAKTILPEHSVVLAAFAIGNGASTQENLLNPREPLPDDNGLTLMNEFNGWLPFSLLDPLPVVSSDGNQYLLKTKLKKHVSDINPVLKIDEADFYYTEHTLKIQEEECIGNYFNEICLFFEINDGVMPPYYLPYSKFSFAGLPNLGGKNSYTILYGTYL